MKSFPTPRAPTDLIISAAMKFLIALVLVLLPFNAVAQSQSSSTAKKLEWIGIGAVAGGVAAVVVGITRHQDAPIIIALSNVPCSAVSASATCLTLLAGSSGITLMPPGTMQSGTMSGSVVFSNQQQRATNWRITGPAIGAAGAGILLFELGHKHA